MKIIDQKVEVIYPRTLEDGVFEQKMIELAGRNCWRSEGKITPTSYRRFVDAMIERGHGTPIEFGHVIMRLTTGRDVLAEITRHRLASFCVESQRYVNEGKEEGGIKFIRPLFYKPFDPYYDYKSGDKAYEASRIWDDAMENAEQYYNTLIAGGMKNEDARKVLPNSCATTIFMKVNLRELRHIYALRSATSAYPEIRELMRLMKIEIDKVLPGVLPEKEEK